MQRYGGAPFRLSPLHSAPRRRLAANLVPGQRVAVDVGDLRGEVSHHLGLVRRNQPLLRYFEASRSDNSGHGAASNDEDCSRCTGTMSRSVQDPCSKRGLNRLCLGVTDNSWEVYNVYARLSPPFLAWAGGDACRCTPAPPSATASRCPA